MRYARAFAADLLLAFANWCRDQADRADTRLASALDPGDDDD